jgi:hypothetical protein
MRLHNFQKNEITYKAPVLANTEKIKTQYLRMTIHDRPQRLLAYDQKKKKKKKSSSKWNQNQKTKTEKKRRRPYLRNYKLLSVAGVSERQERGRESIAGGGQKLLRESRSC